MNNQVFNTQQFISDMQRDLMFHIIMNSKKGLLHRSKAQTIARNFLGLKKSETIEQFLHTMVGFIPESAEMHEVFVKHAPHFYEYDRNLRLSDLREQEYPKLGGGE